MHISSSRAAARGDKHVQARVSGRPANTEKSGLALGVVLAGLECHFCFKTGDAKLLAVFW